MNIAMVDDNQADLDKMKGALTEYAAANGAEIAFHTFLSGEKLLADYRPFLYAVVFLDIFMDGMTGIEVAMADPDLCGMTGNILENAIAACRGVPEQERSVQLQSRVHNDTYFIIVATNAFNGNVRMKNGTYLSTHKNGRGIGLSSIRSTAEKYGGIAEFSHDATKFYTNIMIPVLENRPFSV